MAGFGQRVVLGRSGLEVGPLALSGGYGIEAAGVHKAVDRGCTYLYHGSRRAPGMERAIRELVAAGRRDELVVVLQSYTRWSPSVERSLARGLRRLGIDHADVLLLGWYNRSPGRRLLERVERMRERGMFTHLAISGHRRPSFVAYAADPRFEILHLRYNAAHTGAEQDVFPHLSAGDRPGIVAYTATSWGSLMKASKMPPGERPLRGRDAYRFVLSQPDIQVCTAGPRSMAELDEALAALDEGPVSPEEDRRFRAIGAAVRGRPAARGVA